MRCTPNFLIFYTVLFVLFTNALHGKDSKNRWTGTSFYNKKNQCLCEKIAKLFYFDCVFAIRVYYQSLKTRSIYKI